jgi:hypothetical protein
MDMVMQDELFGIMNLLDGCLKVANSAVVLAATKCFLKVTQELPDIQRQVFLRLKTPLLTLIASSSNEISYAVLCHITLIVDRAPGVFDEEFKQFFCKFNEVRDEPARKIIFVAGIPSTEIALQPGSVKSLKMAIMPKLANPANSREIVGELSEYVGGVDSELARQAIRAIAEIAIRVNYAAEPVIESLLEALDTDAEYVRSETVIVLQDILRKYPERAHSVIPSLHRCLKRMEGASGRAAVIWMIGEYGHLIEDAPYLLEPIIDNLKDEESVVVRNEVLTATLKLFFKRPPEVQKMMGRLFKFCLSENVSAAVHDRALLYFRLLRSNVREAGAVINADKQPVLEFHSEQSNEVKEKIFSEFNSLSVLYGKPSEQFISADHLITPLDAPGNRAAGGVASSDGDTLLAEAETPSSEHSGVSAHAAPVHAPAPAPAPKEIDLLGEDLLGIGGSYSSAPVPTFGGAAFGLGAPAPAPAPVALRIGATLDPAAFQSKWGTLPVAQTLTLRAPRVVTTAEVETLTRNAGIYTIASGDVGTQLKFYFFTSDSPSTFHLFEVVFDKTNGVLTATIKTDNASVLPAVVQLFAAALRPIPFQ